MSHSNNMDHAVCQCSHSNRRHLFWSCDNTISAVKNPLSLSQPLVHSLCNASYSSFCANSMNYMHRWQIDPPPYAYYVYSMYFHVLRRFRWRHSLPEFPKNLTRHPSRNQLTDKFNHQSGSRASRAQRLWKPPCRYRCQCSSTTVCRYDTRDSIMKAHVYRWGHTFYSRGTLERQMLLKNDNLAIIVSMLIISLVYGWRGYVFSLLLCLLVERWMLRHQLFKKTGWGNLGFWGQIRPRKNIL